jgi:class 3 adenylate cyclase
MDINKLDELLAARKLADSELEKLRTAVTILFSDIKGSTSYFERKGDVEGLAMLQRHNNLLFPCIEQEGGRVVKTIGDAIMACFEDPVGAVRAAILMQRALEDDRESKLEDEHIHVRVGLHTGLGLIKDDDVYGDVVNAAARVQHQAEPDQILITDVLLPAAKAARAEVQGMGRAEMRGKDEAIDVYAVAWSDSSREQLLEQISLKYEKKIKEMKRQNDQLEEEIEAAREQGRTERRRLTEEIEELEDTVERQKAGSRHEASEDLQAQIRFQLEESQREKKQLEQELVAMQAKWETERNSLKTQIASIQGSALEAMERSNNPTRLALAVREQVDAKLRDAKQDWQLEWEGERRRLNMEIERLKKAGNVDEKKDAAKRALLQKLGKLPSGAGGTASKTADQWQREFEDAKVQWDTERDQLKLKIERMEREAQRSKDEVRNEIYHEIRGQYQPKLAEAERECKRLQEELDSVNGHLAEDRKFLTQRIEQLELAIPEAQEATRIQVTAELQDDFDNKLEELNRAKARNERRSQDAVEELESQLRRTNKQISSLEEQLKEARESAFRAQRGSRGKLPEEF